MDTGLTKTYVVNALALLKAERRTASRVDMVYRRLMQPLVKGSKNLDVEADLVDWLANPFIRTALSILEKLQGNNYKISQAIRLLKEAGEDQGKKTKKGR